MIEERLSEIDKRLKDLRHVQHVLKSSLRKCRATELQHLLPRHSNAARKGYVASRLQRFSMRSRFDHFGKRIADQ